MSDCPPNYKNLNRIQSFSEDRNITVQLVEQACMNDEFLKQYCDELKYLTPPAIRKRFCPILIDDVQSWGYQLNQDNTITFSTETTKKVTIDFSDFSYVDENKSDCTFETYQTFDSDGNISTVSKKAVVPYVDMSTLNTDCKNWGDTVNSYWYVSYDKAKNYQVRPDWLNNFLDGEIPSVARAQTFTVPSGITNGVIDSIDIFLENNGTPGSNWGSPLYVRIVPVIKRTVKKTKWDKTQKKSVPDINPSTGKQYTEEIWVPDTFREQKTLAMGTFQPNKVSPGVQNIPFDKKVTVNSDEHYAIIFSSPLSHPEHCPRIGGWGRNCDYHPYEYGDAFLSEDNGRTWGRYGRNDDTVKTYKEGLLTPQDFAFKMHIIEPDEGRDTGEEYYFYTKPIHANPIKTVTVNSICWGNEQSATDVDLVFQVSNDGRNWTDLNNDNQVIFSRNSTTGEYPTICFVRAKLSTDDSDLTPYIEKIEIVLDLDAPSELYARSYYYRPKLTPMLGASHWGRVFAPFTLEPTVTGSVEIIKDTIYTEHFKIITAFELDQYTGMGLDDEKITDEDLDVRYQYLVDTPSAIALLKEKNVYVKPWTHTVDGESVTEPLSFSDGIQFINSPAYPIVEARIDPENDDRKQVYAEWCDFSFDYDYDRLNFFTDSDVLDSMPVGSLSVSYNPVFIQDLVNEEVGLREADEGLILDYFKESFTVTEDDVETRRLRLRVAPADPIREVTHNEIILREDIDFTVDYDKSEIIFPVKGDSSILNPNDIVNVVYTPSLEDTGIAIGYRAKRTNKDKTIIISENYIEYKV